MYKVYKIKDDLYYFKTDLDMLKIDRNELCKSFYKNCEIDREFFDKKMTDIKLQEKITRKKIRDHKKSLLLVL